MKNEYDVAWNARLFIDACLWYRFKESTVLREKMDAIIEAQEIH